MHLLASGPGWRVEDVVLLCRFPRDRPFEEQHDLVCAAVVTRGAFEYRTPDGRATLVPGLLANGAALVLLATAFRRRSISAGTGSNPCCCPPGMALATVAIGHGLPFWAKERRQHGHVGSPVEPRLRENALRALRTRYTDWVLRKGLPLPRTPAVPDTCHVPTGLLVARG
jgi:hypothetical protein